MVITLYIYSVHERMKVWMKKTTIYQFEETYDIDIIKFENIFMSCHVIEFCKYFYVMPLNF